jgi:hypothetical protein
MSEFSVTGMFCSAASFIYLLRKFPTLFATVYDRRHNFVVPPEYPAYLGVPEISDVLAIFSCCIFIGTTVSTQLQCVPNWYQYPPRLCMYQKYVGIAAETTKWYQCSLRYYLVVLSPNLGILPPPPHNGSR